MTDIESVEIYVCGQQKGDDQSTCQECFTRELFGDKANNERNTQPGDTLLLYDYGNQNNSSNNDKFVYGPFTAESSLEKDIEEDAWNGEFPNQVRVSWDQLYRLPADETPVNIFQSSPIEGENAEDLVQKVTEEGVKIQVTDNGTVKPIDELDEEDEEETDDKESKSTDDEDSSEGIRDIVEVRDIADPLPRAEEVKQDPNPGVAMIRAAVSDGEPRPELYEEALVHLIAGKNVIFYGPPGSGKTRIAERLSQALCSTVRIETANAEWTNQDIVGGYHPEGDGFRPSPGILTEAAETCVQSLENTEPPHPSWLLIDELNRANLDEAFGEVFTMLDLSYRGDSDLRYADGERQTVPLAFRVLGTMNSEDQAQLFALGYAFRRRFAFVEVPPVYHQSEQSTSEIEVNDVDLDPAYEKHAHILKTAAIEGFEHESAIENDSVFSIPYLEDILTSGTGITEAVNEAYNQAQEATRPPDKDITFDRAIQWFVQELSDRDIASIGQGIVIDAYKFIIVYHMLFPDAIDWQTVDKAVVAYILPQIESHMSDLRRAGTVSTDSEAAKDFDEIIDCARKVGFGETAARLEDAQETHEIIG